MGPETRAGPHDRRNGKARGEDGTDEIVGSEERERWRRGPKGSAVERENRRDEWQRRGRRRRRRREERTVPAPRQTGRKAFEADYHNRAS